MTTSRPTLLRCLLLVAAGLVSAADLTLQNRAVLLQYREASGEVTLWVPGESKPFARFDAATQKPSAVRTVRLNEPRLGAGEALEFDFPHGSRNRVMLFADLPFAVLRTSWRGTNTTNPVNRIAYPAVRLALDRPAEELTSLGTGGLLQPKRNPGSYMWTAVADPATRRGVVAGWLTTDRGSGIVRMAVAEECVTLLPHLDYGRLAPNADREEDLELFALGLFDDARFGLEAYADAIARIYAIRLPPMPTVHCTWYVDRASNERVMTDRTAYAAQTLKPFGLRVMQIDDGWQSGQSTNGPKKVFIRHRPDGPYPAGMKAMSDTIRAAGMTAGIWLIPFAGSREDPWFADKTAWFAKRSDGSPFDTRWGGTCFDLTRRDTQAYLRDMIRTLTAEWGYRYLKMDALYAGAAINLNYVCNTFREDEIGQAILTDPSVTPIQMMRNSLKIVRDTAGRDVFLLGCCTPQNMRSAGAAFGLVDAMRIGPDNGANWSAMMRGPEYGAWNYFLHGRVWYNDPDPLYVRPSLPIHQAQALAAWVTLSGQMNSSSEHYAGLPPDRLDLLRRTMPSHQAVARPADLFENRIPGIWLVTDGATAERPQRQVAGLFNWDGTNKTFNVPLASLGLETRSPWIGFEYWGNTLTPPFRHSLPLTLPPQSSAVLALCPIRDRPQLISTSRHITQGITDVRAVTWDPVSRTLSGVSDTVADDRYELRILTHADASASFGTVLSAAITGPNGYELTIAPGEGQVTRPDDAYAHANTPDAPRTTLFEPKSEEGLVRLAFISGSGGQVSWRVIFSERTISALTPPAP